MPRPKNPIPTVEMKFLLRSDLREMVDSKLYSEFEGRVPYGAYRDYFEKLIVADLLGEKK